MAGSVAFGARLSDLSLTHAWSDRLIGRMNPQKKNRTCRSYATLAAQLVNPGDPFVAAEAYSRAPHGCRHRCPLGSHANARPGMWTPRRDPIPTHVTPFCPCPCIGTPRHHPAPTTLTLFSGPSTGHRTRARAPLRLIDHEPQQQSARGRRCEEAELVGSPVC